MKQYIKKPIIIQTKQEYHSTPSSNFSLDALSFKGSIPQFS